MARRDLAVHACGVLLGPCVGRAGLRRLGAMGRVDVHEGRQLRVALDLLARGEWHRRVERAPRRAVELGGELDRGWAVVDVHYPFRFCKRGL